MLRYVSNNLRLAFITHVDHGAGIAYTQWIDHVGEKGPSIPIPHPYAGISGEGIFIGIQPGNVVVLDMASHERYFPVAMLPPQTYYDSDLSTISDTDFSSVSFPSLNPGDIVIQGIGGGQLKFDKDCGIQIQNCFGEGIVYSGESNDSSRCSIIKPLPSEYILSQSGIKASGTVRRNSIIESGELDFTNLFDDVQSEFVFEEVALDAKRKPAHITSATANGEKNFRNPAVVEDRQLIYEFGKKWNFEHFINEIKKKNDGADNNYFPNFQNRSEIRNNILGLTLSNPNELIECTKGTLVDIFGNFLDINREIILSVENKNNSFEKYLENTLENMRHTVAFHMEINTRKGWTYDSLYHDKIKPINLQTHFPDPQMSANNSRSRSKWSVDVDKEGLTKINIPSTSETGNIPVLCRHENSSFLEIDNDGKPTGKAREDDAAGKIFRNEQNKDIFLDQFGPGGIKILDSSGANEKYRNRLTADKTSYVDYSDLNTLAVSNVEKDFPDSIEAGTAFHDITQTAAKLLKENINIIASDMISGLNNIGEFFPAVSTTIDPRVAKDDDGIAERDPKTGLPIDQPNAGGRSAQINMDGSLELSVGANTIDRTSFTLDTAGSIVARIGRDRFGRSAILQADGTVVLEVGGFDFLDQGDADVRFANKSESRSDTLPQDPKRFKSGKVVIRLRRSNPNGTGPDEDNDDHLLVWDDTGITIQSAGRLNLLSKMDMTIESGSRILLEAPKVQIYKDTAKFIRRDGRNS